MAPGRCACSNFSGASVSTSTNESPRVILRYNSSREMVGIERVSAISTSLAANNDDYESACDIARQLSAQRLHSSAQRFISAPPSWSHDAAQASHTAAHAAQVWT